MEIAPHSKKVELKFSRGAKSPTKAPDNTQYVDSELELFPMDETLAATPKSTKKDRIECTSTLKEVVQDTRHGIPIPVARKGAREHTCVLNMDDDSVLEELAAYEGGFNRSWQNHRGP